MQIGALDAVTAVFAAAPPGLSGDYLYGDHREPYREAGLWGLFRVYAQGDGASHILPLR
jgi:hypothetical protein